MSLSTLVGPKPSGSRTVDHDDPDEPVVVMWSGDSRTGERRARDAVLEALRSATPESVMSRVPAGRPGRFRGAVVTARGRAEYAVVGVTPDTVTSTGPRPVALLLPGQGSQFPGMARGLYDRYPVLRNSIDEVLALWGPEGSRIREDWLSDEPRVEPDDVSRAQPMLFAVELALGRLLVSWGVRPVGLLGHSAGEVVAATLAGVFTVREAIRVVRDRIRASEPIPAGGMLAVAASVDEVRTHLTDEVAIAAVNAGRQTMLAGPSAELAEVARRLDDDGYAGRPVPATTPFHSPAMAPAVAEMTRTFDVVPRPPRVPVWSGYTGARLTRAEAESPEFWARQLEETVYFGPALSALLETGRHLLVETGPGRTLTAFARRQRAVSRGDSTAVSMFGEGPDVSADAERRGVLDVAAQLWREGHDLAPGPLGAV